MGFVVKYTYLRNYILWKTLPEKRTTKTIELKQKRFGIMSGRFIICNCFARIRKKSVPFGPIFNNPLKCNMIMQCLLIALL